MHAAGFGGLLEIIKRRSFQKEKGAPKLFKPFDVKATPWSSKGLDHEKSPCHNSLICL
jgi:hypothetical protein